LKRPIAHRGLHDEGKGIVENSASAIEAAIAKGYAVEVDLQCAKDDQPVVFHDATLERLTSETAQSVETAIRDFFMFTYPSIVRTSQAATRSARPRLIAAFRKAGPAKMIAE